MNKVETSRPVTAGEDGRKTSPTPDAMPDPAAWRKRRPNYAVFHIYEDGEHWVRVDEVDRWLRAYGQDVIERCALTCLNEAVDAEATGDEGDEAYNMALEHAAAAIRSLATKAGEVPDCF